MNSFFLKKKKEKKKKKRGNPQGKFFSCKKMAILGRVLVLLEEGGKCLKNDVFREGIVG